MYGIYPPPRCAVKARNGATPARIDTRRRTIAPCGKIGRPRGAGLPWSRTSRQCLCASRDTTVNLREHRLQWSRGARAWTPAAEDAGETGHRAVPGQAADDGPSEGLRTAVVAFVLVRFALGHANVGVG